MIEMNHESYIENIKDTIHDIEFNREISTQDYNRILSILNSWKYDKEFTFKRAGVDIFYLEEQIDKIQGMYSYISDDSFSIYELTEYMNDEEDNIVAETYNWQSEHNSQLDEKYSLLFDLYRKREYEQAFRELKRIEKADKDENNE